MNRTPAEKSLIVTADDFGLTDEINRGIVASHRNGIVTAASFLVNAPATDEAWRLAKSHPDLEIGIHLGVVEGYCLTAPAARTITDEARYLGDKPCLHRHWKPFLARYVRGRINLTELERELEAQIRRFLDYFPSIPFANATQHLHVVPGVRRIVAMLARKYGIRAVRIHHGSRTLARFNARWGYNTILRRLGRDSYPAFRDAGLRMTRHFAGFDVCGKMRAGDVIRILGQLRPGTTELMAHPGEDCPYLRDNLPWGYADFRWSSELKALTDPRVKAAVRENEVRLIRFSDL